MRIIATTILLVMILTVSGCGPSANIWPDRTGRTPQAMLADVVRWQQLLLVKKSTGELQHEAFTWVDLHAFFAGDQHKGVVGRLRQAPDFDEILRKLRALTPDEQRSALLSAASIARPTWRVMGYIDRTGTGQTEAGHIADLMVAGAIADGFAAGLGVEAPRPPEDWRVPGPRSWPAE